MISIDRTHNVQFWVYVYMYIWNSLQQMPSPFGVGPAHEKKIGHRRVDASGETTYKKASVSSPSVSPFSPANLHTHLTLLFFTLFSTSRPPPLHCKGPSSWALVTLSAPSAPSLREMCWCRTFTLWRASSSPGTFVWVNVCFCACMPQVSNLTPLFSSSCWSHFATRSEGSNLTPAHHYPDFRFKTYAPVAFRYFRELFGIRPDDYLVRIPRLPISHLALEVSAEKPSFNLSHVALEDPVNCWSTFL